MSTRYLFYVIGSVVVGIMIWVTAETLTQPGIADLEVGFEEMAQYRNENNTGPIIRMYAVYSPDTAWQQMKAYGDFMPHTKYGNTKVFFFDQKENIPQELSPDPPVFDAAFQAYCIAIYEKSAMGEVRFIKFPFR
jgi:hypothetical protein